MHVGLVGVLISILMYVGVPEIVVVIEARDLKATHASRLGDVVVLNFFVEGRHLVVDVVSTATLSSSTRRSSHAMQRNRERIASSTRTASPHNSSMPSTVDPTSWSHSRWPMGSASALVLSLSSRLWR